MSRTSTALTLSRRSGLAGALAVALLLASGPAAWADGGVRHGGARRAPPPPPPQQQPQQAPRLQAPRSLQAPRTLQAPRSLPHVSGGNLGPATTSMPRVHQPGTLAPRALPQMQPRGGVPSTAVRPIQLGQQPRVGSGGAGGPLPRVSAPAPGVLPRPLLQPRTGLPTSPLAGTGASPTWDTRRFANPSLGTPNGGLVATPRASLPRVTGGAAQRVPGVRSTPLVGGTGLIAPSAPRSFTGSAGAGIQYGGRPHATGYFGHVHSHHAHHRHHHHGHHGLSLHFGWGYPSYPYVPTYVLSPTIVNVWGYGVYEPAPVFVEQPWVAPPPVIVEPPTYVIPQPAPVAPLEPPAPQVAPVEPGPAPGFPPPSPSPDAQGPGSQERGPANEPTPLGAEDQRALEQSVEAFRAGSYADSLATLEALAQRKPDLGHAWLGISHAAFASGRYDRAAQALTKATLLGAFPRGYAFDPRGLYAQASAFDERMAALEAHVQARPGDAYALLVRAWLRLSLGERAGARADLDQVLTLRPSDEAAPLLAIALLPPAPEAK